MAEPSPKSRRPAAAGHRAAAHPRGHRPLHRGRGPRAEAPRRPAQLHRRPLVRENLTRAPDAVLVPGPNPSAETRFPPGRAAPGRPPARRRGPRRERLARGRPAPGRSTRCAGRPTRSGTSSGGGRDRSRHRLRTRHQGDGLLHHPRPDFARQSPAHDLGTGGVVRLPRHPDHRHRPDGSRDARTDRQRPRAEGDGRDQRPRAQAEETVHAHRVELPGGDRGPAEAGHAVRRRRRPEEHPPRRPPLRGLRGPHRHGPPARPRRRQSASTPRRAGRRTSTRAPRSVSAGGRSSTSATTGGSSCPRASNGARRRWPDGTSSTAAARAACRASKPARPPRGCTRGRRRSEPANGRPHPPGPRRTSARSGRNWSNASAARCGVSGLSRRAGGAPATRMANLPGRAGRGALSPRPRPFSAPQCVEPQAARRRRPSAHRAATRPPDRTRVARAPPRTRRGPRLAARRRRRPRAVPATPARGRRRGRARPARSRPPPERGRPRRRTTAPGLADPRPPQQGGDQDRDRTRTRERRPAIPGTPTPRITRRAHTTARRRRA